MQCANSYYETVTSYHDPYEWNCREYKVTTVNGEENSDSSVAECPIGSRMSGCMCFGNEKGCKGSYINDNRCIA